MKYFDILWKWRRFIVINVGCVAIVTVIITLLLPKWYKSTASILPPKDSGMMGGLGAASSLLSDFAGGALGSLGGSEGAYNYFAILGSRTVMQSVAEQFDLMTVYDISDSSMEKTLEALEDNVSFEEQQDEYITIEVLDKDPERAAAMANFFVRRLNEISIRLGTEEARSNRMFIERQLLTNREDLRQAEDSLRIYQERTGTIVAIDPSSPGVSPIAELYALKAKKEIELAILKRRASSDNALVRQLELELSEINKKTATFPVLGIESLRLYRHVAIQQKILEFLIPLYEQAKVDEQKDVPVLLVLDTAVPAELKTKPQRALIVLVITFLAFALTLAIVLPVEQLLTSKGERSEVEEFLVQLARKVMAFYKVRLS